MHLLCLGFKFTKVKNDSKTPSYNFRFNNYHRNKTAFTTATLVDQ